MKQIQNETINSLVDQFRDKVKDNVSIEPYVLADFEAFEDTVIDDPLACKLSKWEI